ncbi:ROK family glucokinase [Fodinisporobacter ferrooxydans]|uniref:Glucokinase n=1 Tax=Fodinisporobacter ferrooxydans TaxID=2901836 RepID=A0ABY4CM09_9BACL|nr:ROK family glucokinase [Alicyclobacillaceae bacterium MYW30-H2]
MNESMESRAIGIDLGGTNIKAAAVTGKGTIVAKIEWPTEADKGADHVIKRMQEMARTVVANAGWQWSDVCGLGIGLPGFLDHEAGVVEQLVNLHWRNVPILDIMKKDLGIPVYFDNDANAAAIGEAWVGGGQGFEHVVAVTIGTGIGGGIIIDGRIHRGANGMCGEIGHLVMYPQQGRRCNCGKIGCLETISSATAILQSAVEALAAGVPTRLAEIPIDQLTTKDVVDLAKSGDPLANEIIKRAMETLGFALSYIGNTLNPQRFVIGGGVSKAGAILFDLIQKGFEDAALSRVVEACKIVPATLGNDAGVIGAAKLAIF